MSPRIVIVTGTSTDVGKTIATAALAAGEAAAGRSVLLVKPVQTGVEDDAPGDGAVVTSLTGLPVETWAALPEPLAPDVAARRAGVSIPTVVDHATRVRERAADQDVVVLEGAGGLLVRLDADGGTLLDLAADLAGTHTVEVVVVCAAGLGTLNHTELTVGALRARGVEPAGLVVGSWPVDPDQPDLAQRCNLEDLPRVTGLPVLAVLPAGSGQLDREDFLAQAAGWFSIQR